MTILTTITIVVLAIIQLINSRRISFLRDENKRIKSSIQSIRDSRKSDFNKTQEDVIFLGRLFRVYLGITNIDLHEDKSHVIIDTKEGLMFMDLCKMNKQFVPLLKVGKTIPSENERIHYRGQDYHYVPVKELPCTDF